jgi:hypothetical protein
MRPPKYALTPLADLREKRVGDATRGLARQVIARTLAERDHRAAEEKRVAHDAVVEQVRHDEDDALARGELRALDLARADAWQVRVGAERAAIVAQVDRSRAVEARARESEQSARGELIAKQADADVVARDHARWSEAMRKRAEAKEEEMASDAWRPKR